MEVRNVKELKQGTSVNFDERIKCYNPCYTDASMISKDSCKKYAYPLHTRVEVLMSLR